MMMTDKNYLLDRYMGILFLIVFLGFLKYRIITVIYRLLL